MTHLVRPLTEKSQDAESSAGFSFLMGNHKTPNVFASAGSILLHHPSLGLSNKVQMNCNVHFSLGPDLAVMEAERSHDLPSAYKLESRESQWCNPALTGKPEWGLTV